MGPGLRPATWPVLCVAMAVGLQAGACGNFEASPASATLGQASAVTCPIVAGTPSALHDFPATGVILYHSDDAHSPMGAMLCSGTLVAPDVVLAAGHCQERFAQENGPSVRYYFSLAQDVSTFGPLVQQVPDDAVPVTYFLPHPDYDAERQTRGLGRAADLGLFFLRNPMTHVAPARLASKQSLEQVGAGTQVTIVGYGRRLATSYGRRDEGVKYQGVSTIGAVGPFEMQVGLSGGTDALKCHGDSGGPTYLHVNGPDGRQPTLIGITSRSQDWSGCSRGGIDTRVDAYLPWIEDSLAWGCAVGLRSASCAKWDADLTIAVPRGHNPQPQGH